MSKKTTKDTTVCFGWMKEGHYPKILFRDIELDLESNPKMPFVKKEEHPELWYLMEVLEATDLKIEGVQHITLLLWHEKIEDNFLIKFFSGEKVMSAGSISIFDLTSEQVIELLKKKVTAELK